MTILVPTLAVAFAAFCVWLGVRIINRRERWAKRVGAALVVMAVGYPLSIGPVFCVRIMIGDPQWARDTYEFTYLPILWIYGQSPQPIQNLIEWYFNLWANCVGET